MVEYKKNLKDENIEDLRWFINQVFDAAIKDAENPRLDMMFSPTTDIVGMFASDHTGHQRAMVHAIQLVTLSAVKRKVDREQKSRMKVAR